jgi:Lsr2
LRFSRSTIYFRVTPAVTQEETVAQRVVLTDDLDGSEAAETITYTVNGQDYEIDLSEENTQRFYDTFGQYIERSRRVERQTAPTRRGRGNGRRRGGAGGRDDIPLIRAWAESQGMDVSTRGRIKKEIIAAYDEAHS